MDAGPLRVLMVNARTTAFGSAIAHYTDRLCESLSRLGVDIARLEMADWGPSAMGAAMRPLHSADIVHVQFPMNGYGRSLLPHALALRSRSVVTVHEASVFGRFTGRAMLFPMLLRSRLVFTVDYELAFTKRWARWIGPRSCVIPIGSNIQTVFPREPGDRRAMVFGSLYARKGLDDVVEFARLAEASGAPWSVRIVGSTRDDRGAHEQHLREVAGGLPVEFTGRLDDADVAREFARATVGYFPFRDGASARHGSLLAAFAAGLPVISTVGRLTTPAIREAIVAVGSAREALDAAERLRADPAECTRLSAAGHACMTRHSWAAIGAQHLALYEEMRATTKARRR